MDPMTPRIAKVNTYVLVDPHYEARATSSAQDDILVEILTDSGVAGYGETDANPWMVKAAIEAPGTHSMGRGLAELLIGENPLDIETLWDRLYVGSAMNGRRGLVVHAIGALDIALHDLAGKLLDKPCHALLGNQVKTEVVPYASLQPDADTVDAYHAMLVDWAKRAKSLGFRAAKVECTFSGPYAHLGLHASHDRVTQMLRDVRAAVGPDFTLMVDVQYAFPDAHTAVDVLRQWESLDLYFVEAPIWPDDLDGMRYIVEHQPIPIASGEWLATRHEFADLIDRAHIPIIQPDIGRVGGFTEARRVAELARERGVTVIPHAWKTGLSIAAALQFAAVTEHCPFVEYLPADMTGSLLRKELVMTDFVLQNGALSVPNGPGLGSVMNFEFIRAHALRN
jgi:L-alanine-DL-glutamate epimerase-like enolase superfamily enzyme